MVVRFESGMQAKSSVTRPFETSSWPVRTLRPIVQDRMVMIDDGQRLNKKLKMVELSFCLQRQFTSFLLKALDEKAEAMFTSSNIVLEPELNLCCLFRDIFSKNRQLIFQKHERLFCPVHYSEANGFPIGSILCLQLLLDSVLRHPITLDLVLLGP